MPNKNNKNKNRMEQRQRKTCCKHGMSEKKTKRDETKDILLYIWSN